MLFTPLFHSEKDVTTVFQCYQRFRSSINGENCVLDDTSLKYVILRVKLYSQNN